MPDLFGHFLFLCIMKQFLLVGLTFLWALNSSAQVVHTEKELKKHAEKVQKSRDKGKNIRSLDTLFASGTPYCLMIGTRKGIAGIPSAYSVRPLKSPNEEEIFLTMESEGTGSAAVWFWDMVFINPGQKIRFKNGELDLENTIVDYDLFNDSALNIKGMTKLVLLKGPPGVNVPQAQAQKSGMVDRNRSGMIQIFGEKIQQVGVHIGNISKSTVASDGNIITQITISFITGEIVAVAKNHGVTDHEWSVVTMKNNESHDISSSLGKDEQDIVKYLVESLYL